MPCYYLFPNLSCIRAELQKIVWQEMTKMTRDSYKIELWGHFTTCAGKLLIYPRSCRAVVLRLSTGEWDILDKDNRTSGQKHIAQFVVVGQAFFRFLLQLCLTNGPEEVEPSMACGSTTTTKVPWTCSIPVDLAATSVSHSACGHTSVTPPPKIERLCWSISQISFNYFYNVLYI